MRGNAIEHSYYILFIPVDPMKMTARRRRRGRRTSLAANFRKTSWRARSHRSIFLLALYPLSSGGATVPPSLSLVKFIRAVIIAAIMSGCISPKQSLYSSPLKGKDRRRSLPLPRARRGGERSRLMARKVICMEIWRPCARPSTGHPDSLSSDDRAANVVWRTHCLLMLIDFED